MIGIKELNKAMWAFANAGVSKILLHPDNFDKLCLAAHILYPSSRLTTYGIYVEKSLLAPADALDEEKRAFTRAMFDRFLAAGINVGVEVEIKIDLNKIIRPTPLKIVGICSRGFVYVDADGKEGIFGCGALKILDRVIVKQQ